MTAPFKALQAAEHEATQRNAQEELANLPSVEILDEMPRPQQMRAATDHYEKLKRLTRAQDVAEAQTPGR